MQLPVPTPQTPEQEEFRLGGPPGTDPPKTRAGLCLPTGLLRTYVVPGAGLSVGVVKRSFALGAPSPGKEMGGLVMFAEQSWPGGEKLPAECLTHIPYLLANIPSPLGPSDGAAAGRRMGGGGRGEGEVRDPPPQASAGTGREGGKGTPQRLALEPRGHQCLP